MDFTGRVRCMVDDEADFIYRLFAQEVPEIAAGIVEIKAISRQRGYRSKLALQSHDPQVDCIGACVGTRGARIQEIVDALDGERIDLIRWHDSPERFIANALQPAAIEEVILHRAQQRAVVVVQAEQASLARGRRGQNRDLASRLCGWQIEIEED